METAQSALIFPVRGLPTMLETLRLQYDPLAATGIDPHLTITVPFLPVGEINSKTHALMREVARGVYPFTSRFNTVQVFQKTVYLSPDDPTPYHQMLERVLKLWPGYPPYGGQHAEYIPHLTLANEISGPKQSELLNAIPEFLPCEIFFNDVHLITKERTGWRAQAYRLGPPKSRYDTR